MTEFAWRDLSAIATSLVVIGGLVWLVLRSRLGGEFATPQDLQRLDVRLQAVETRIATMPNHADITTLSARLGIVERQIGVVEAELKGISQLLVRVERSTDLLVQHHLGERTS